ncbi:hypothetical protein DTJ15_03435 [Parasaccharibacter sp. TMW 2.1891]|uniref:hypothetical protein n=1 Tax=Parasaccharibacter sp. TMW 2.1891 TaxID=2267836 RepID=UPI0020131CCB|nr:hypothetical protein [Parasaccharibacter sp. TMW 2.1891]MCL1513266.1 hypothetical protein [Parasaccharibacter sp. TMW 2.1891]
MKGKRRITHGDDELPPRALQQYDYNRTHSALLQHDDDGWLQRGSPKHAPAMNDEQHAGMLKEAQ